MTIKYQAAVVHNAGGPMTFDERETPQLGPREALIKLRATGVCHSDVHTVDGDWLVPPPFPNVPGHEGIGEVVALGGEVQGVEIGELLGIGWNNRACGECSFCQDGWETLCDNLTIHGYHIDGSFAQYMVVDTKYAARIPEGADVVEVAPLLCAGVTVYKGLKQASATPGSWVAVVGVGGLGHLAVQYARAMGYRVVAVDINSDALELAQEHGAEFVVNSRDADAAEQITARIPGGPATAFVSATHPSAYELAIRVVRKHGTVICIGIPASAVSVHMYDVAARGLTLLGSTVGTRKDIEESIDYHTRGLVKPTVTARRFDELNDMIDDLRSGRAHGRSVVDFSL